MGISSPGIGSNLPINDIVSKLMAVESQPLQTLAKREAATQAKVAALGTLGAAVSSFKGSLSSLSSASTFQSISATAADTSIATGTATSTSVAGTYNLNVTQLAQAQTLTSAGRASVSASIGSGSTTTVNFQFGSVSGGAFGMAGTNLGSGVASGGISNGSLTINGTAISTDSGTKSAKALAEAINAKATTSGVTATAGATSTSATLFSGFGDIDTSGGGTYALSVGGVEITTQATGVAAGDGVKADALDTILGGVNAVTTALAAANITFSGTAAAGTLTFTQADGSNIEVKETVTGSVGGGIGKTSVTANLGSSVTATAGVTLNSSSASPITIGGTNAAAAGLTAGTGGAYVGSSFAQDGSLNSGSVTIDSSNNTLAGIRDAINKANLGITATIVSDGSATPNHLVLSSSKTGANATMKISVSGSPADTDIANLLAYDPAGTQNLTQNAAAKSTQLSINGIAVTSASNSVTGAIQGVNLNVAKVGATSITVGRDSSAVKNGISGFVKAYNDFNTSFKGLTSYDPATKQAGALLGDSTASAVQTQIRKQLTTAITGLSGELTSLSQIGVTFQKDGSLALDQGKLGTAVSTRFDEIAGLFAAVGKTSDSSVKYVSAGSGVKPGTFGIDVTTMATQGSLTGDVNLNAATTTIAANTTWNVTLNGTTPFSSNTTATVNLTAGDYTASQLATMVQSAINGATGFATAGSTVTATVDDNGFLSVKSSRYGSTSNLSISSLTGTASSAVFGAAESVDGVDVAGTINGATATGSGQFLTAGSGSAASGLKIEITDGTTGSRGTVSFSQGYAHQLTSLMDGFTGSKGSITGKSDGYNTSLKAIGKQRDATNEKLAEIERRYRAQFTKLDTAISSMNNTSNFLSQQLSALTSMNNG